jgi:hypothetical protein
LRSAVLPQCGQPLGLFALSALIFGVFTLGGFSRSFFAFYLRGRFAPVLLRKLRRTRGFLRGPRLSRFARL